MATERNTFNEATRVQMPFVDYSRMVQQFIKDVYEFGDGALLVFF